MVWTDRQFCLLLSLPPSPSGTTTVGWCYCSYFCPGSTDPQQPSSTNTWYRSRLFSPPTWNDQYSICFSHLKTLLIILDSIHQFFLQTPKNCICLVNLDVHRNYVFLCLLLYPTNYLSYSINLSFITLLFHNLLSIINIFMFTMHFNHYLSICLPSITNPSYTYP